MSNALAIAGVTHVLQDLLNDGLVQRKVGDILGTVSVSALPPDRVVPPNGSEPSQLNLFLHQVTPNTGWRNEGLPAVDGAGRHRLGNPPLALNLHYILSAYGAANLHGEILLGHATQLLHENPVLTRQTIRAHLKAPTGADATPELTAVAECGLADQIEQLRITPEYLTTEEVSKLWTATQSQFRPTTAYQVTVVLIESTRPARAALPVLSRGPIDPTTKRERGVIAEPGLIPSVPMIDDVVPADGQPVVLLGETVRLEGHHLNGTGREVVISNARFEIDETLPATGSDSAASMEFVIPTSRAAEFPVGVYRVSARVLRPGETDARETNCLALVLASEITNLPQEVNRVSGTASFTLEFRPEVRKDRRVALLLGRREVEPEARVAQTGSLDFKVKDAPEGDHLVRLRVEGIDSPIIDRTAEVPGFLNRRITIK